MLQHASKSVPDDLQWSSLVYKKDRISVNGKLALPAQLSHSVILYETCMYKVLFWKKVKSFEHDK
jgi:hypothetical protein